MRWALHAVNVGTNTIRSALEAERDHLLRTTPIQTTELEELNDAIRKSYNGPPEITKQLFDARNRARDERPHELTPALLKQMNGAITAAEEMLKMSPQESFVNVSLYGALGDKLGESVQGDPKSRDAYGDRVSVTLDFVNPPAPVLPAPRSNKPAKSAAGTE